MENQKPEMMKIIDEEGKELEVEVLISFELEETGKQYMVYTLNEEDADGNVTIYSSIIKKTGEEYQLATIESDDEWNKVKEVIRELSSDDDTSVESK